MEGDTSIMGNKILNYEFLTLVRDERFPQAIVVGRKILQSTPNNTAVRKFMQFMGAHTQQLQQMAKQRKEQEQYESGEEGEEQGSEDEKSEEEGKQQKSESQESEQSEQMKQITQPKVQLATCTLNNIPHICPRHHKKEVQSMQANDK